MRFFRERQRSCQDELALYVNGLYGGCHKETLRASLCLGKVSFQFPLIQGCRSGDLSFMRRGFPTRFRCCSQGFAIFQLAIAGCDCQEQCCTLYRMPNRQLTNWKSRMSQRQLKTGYFILEGLNSFATVYYLFYLYFFMQMAFGFGNKANLVLAAANGMIYMFGSFFAGRFSQRFGYFKSLKLGLAVMILGLCAGIRADSSGGQIAVMAVIVLGMCFTWPPLEALISENEPPAGVQTMVGIYNVVWAGTGALAYFSGGAMLEKLSMKSLFYAPITVQLIQLGLTVWIERQGRAGDERPRHEPASQDARSAYIAVNTLELNPRPIA